MSVLLELAREARAAVDRGHYDVAVAMRPTPGLRGAILATRPAIVAEIKRATPTRPLKDVHALDQAILYRKGGATALSIVPHPRFQGRPQDVVDANDVGLPILWKDIVVDGRQVQAAARAGARAILLVAALRQEVDLPALAKLARQEGLEIVGEAASAEEARWLQDLGADVVGVNARDLHTLEMHPDRLAEAIRAVHETPALAFSGVTGPADVAHALSLGYRGVLVGSYLMQHPDPAAAVEELRRVTTW